MVNRIPLVLDVEAGNKIKELPAGDNLNLSENNIVNVQNINALGTINAAIITVNGERLVAQNFLNLVDVPNTYVGSENYFVKVKADATGLEFRAIEDIGNLVIDTITVSERLEPVGDNVIEVGTEANKIAEVWAYGLRGSLVGYDGTLVFNAATNQISYSALAGAPQFLSEFQNDVGYLRTVDLDAQWQAIFEGGRPIGGDLVGSVFGNDSTLLIDAMESKIRGDIEFLNATGFIEGETIAILPSAFLDLGETRLLANITPLDAQGGSVGTEQFPFGDAHFVSATIANLTSDTLGLNSEIGIGSIYGTSDLILDAGNRVKVAQGVPFKAGVFNTDQLSYLVGQNGDIIFNSTTNKFQLYQEDEWVTLHEGMFLGNITATIGTSYLNGLVVAGDLTVQGTTTTVDTANTTIKDNVIVLNEGEVGAGVTGVTSGIEIDRGSEANKTFVWDDSVDKWTLGSEALVTGQIETIGMYASVISSKDLGPILQITAGEVGGTGQTILINPQGSDTTVQTIAETHTWRTGPLTGFSSSPYIDFKTAGAFETHNGAYFVGNLTGDVVGSVFGDDSTVIVDAVNNNLNADTLNISTIESAGVLGINPLALSISSQAGVSVAAGAGPLSLASDGSAVYMTGNSGAGSISYNDANGAIILVTTGLTRIEGAAGGNINIGTGTSGTVTLGNGSNTVGFTSGTTVDFDGATISNFTGNITGNIDNATLTVGATTATTIGIGNSSSTTTFYGTVQFPTALIANNLTADDSISITTATGDGNAISIGPGGTNTFINFTADNIRFFGPVTNNINAQGGVTGDITGSVFAQDSTVLVDGLDGIIRGNVDTGSSGTVDTGTATVSTEIKASRLTNLTPGITDLAVNYAGTIDIQAGTNAGAGTSSIILDRLGTSYITMTTEPVNPASSDALISINTTAAAGDVQIGSVASSRSQVVTIYNANVFGTVDGTLTGSVIGSVYAEDSGVMVDAANYAMFTDLMTLTPLSAPPTPVEGMLVVADRINWDPAGKGSGNSYPVYFDGSIWNALY